MRENKADVKNYSLQLNTLDIVSNVEEDDGTGNDDEEEEEDDDDGDDDDDETLRQNIF